MHIALGRGLTVSSADGRVSLTVRGFIQPRLTIDVAAPRTDPMTGTSAQSAPSPTFAVRRARVFLQGTLLGPTLSYLVHFGVVPQDLGNGAPLFDAAVTWSPARDLSIRAGQFFVPFNRNRWISIVRQQMLERPISTHEFNLDRDIGVMIFSDDLLGLDRRLHYSLGVFGGAGRNRLDADYGLLYVARAQVDPLGRFADHDSEWDLSRAGSRLSLGVTAAFNHRAPSMDPADAMTMPAVRADRLHLAADLLFKWRGLTVQAEALARLNARDPGNDVLSTRSGWGYMAQLNYLTPVKLGIGARLSQIFALHDSAQRGAFTDSFEVGGILAYHTLDEALVVAVDYTLRDASAGYPQHSVRLQTQLAF